MTDLCLLHDFPESLATESALLTPGYTLEDMAKYSIVPQVLLLLLESIERFGFTNARYLI